ncbi:MAG: threonine synthase [Sarcina sp.]
MKYVSTRGNSIANSSMEAILKGIADDSGLYVPFNIPNVTNKLNELSKLSYEGLAIELLNEFFSDLGKSNIEQAVKGAYTNKFKVEINNNFLELYHGPTLAFKDAALLILPQLMKISKKLLNDRKDTIILTATSGDTGKAALEGFKAIEGIKVIVLYPKDGVSEIQKYQMITEDEKNLFVIAIEGNFDDAQKAAKRIFLDEDVKNFFEKNNISISSANSINIGRLIPQIVYYFSAYFEKIKNKEIILGEELNFAVPTGNFGNILAGYYAKKMGLPIGKLICASNENNVLTQFFNTGIYNSNRELILTNTPSMDILISSNLERLLFEISNRDSNKIKGYMDNLKNSSLYKIEDDLKENLMDFYANYSTEEDVKKSIKEVYHKYNYLIDTHTAVAYDVYKKYLKETNDSNKFIIVSTASPFKFTRSVLKALDYENSNKSDFELLYELSKLFNLEIPNTIKDLDKKEVKQTLSCKKETIKEKFIKLLRKE